MTGFDSFPPKISWVIGSLGILLKKATPSCLLFFSQAFHLFLDQQGRQDGANAGHYAPGDKSNQIAVGLRPVKSQTSKSGPTNIPKATGRKSIVRNCPKQPRPPTFILHGSSRLKFGSCNSECQQDAIHTGPGHYCTASRLYKNPASGIFCMIETPTKKNRPSARVGR